MMGLSKKLLTALLSAVAAVCLTLGLLFTVPDSASAEAVTPDVTISETNGNTDYLNIEEGVFLGLKDCDSGTAADLLNGKTFAIVLPEGVTEIGKGLADSNGVQRGVLGAVAERGLVQFTLSSTVETIDDYAFFNCTALSDITVPASVRKIGDRAFSNCSSLEAYYFGSGTSALESIGAYAFNGCTALRGITVPASVKSIGAYAFNGCSSVETVNYNAKSATAMPTSMTGIGSAEVTIGQTASGNEITMIPNGLFRNTNIKKVTFNNVRLTTETSMGWSLFEGCANLKSVEFNGCTFKNIRLAAFKGCSSLSEINLEDISGLESIGEEAFYGCSSLLSVAIPSTVRNTTDASGKETLGIGANAFLGCTGLLEVRNESALDIKAGDLGGAKYIYKGDNSHMVPVGDYTFFYYTDDTDSVTKTEVLLVGYNGAGTTLNLPASVTLNEVTYTSYKINDNAFRNNTVIENVTFSPAVSAIGESAFRGCTSLKGVSIPRTVNEAGRYAFYGCSSLSSVVIEDSALSNISEFMFGNCTSLVNLEIPSSVRNIYTSAFEGCINLETATFKTAELYQLGASAFKDCAKLSVVYLPASIRAVGNGAFANCASGLALIAPDKDAYNTYKDQKSGNGENFYGDNILTYEIEVELYSVTTKTELTQTITAYFGVDAELPVQDGYKTSVWYSIDTLSPEYKVDQTAFNGLLNNSDTSEIKLYAKDTAKPQGVTARGVLTYNENGWTTSSYNALFGDSWKSEYGPLYKVEVSAYFDVEGEQIEVPDEAKTVIKDAGRYNLSILISDEESYGQWKQGVPVTVRVNPQMITNLDAFEWGVAGSGAPGNLDPSNVADIQQVYVYGNRPYLEMQYEGDDSNNPELDHEDDYIFNVYKSYLSLTGSEYRIVLKGDREYGGSSQYIKSVTYTGNTGTGWAVYSATATVTLDNNYTLPAGNNVETTSLANQGIEIAQSAVPNQFIITKTWYIIASEGNKLLSGDRQSSYKVENWNYSYKGDTVIPAPVLLYGAGQEDNLISYKLQMFEAAGLTNVLAEFSFNHPDFDFYVNAAMPAGYYVLTVSIKDCTVDDEQHAGTGISIGDDKPYTFDFTVNKANWNTLLKENGSEDGYLYGYFDSDFITKTRTINVDYDGQKTFGDTKAVMPILTLTPEQIHPLTLRAETAWKDGKFDKYYTEFVITYRRAGSGGVYGTLETYTNAPSEIGRYDINYNISAPSYDNSAYDDSNPNRVYTLYIQGLIGAPVVNIDYTRESWAGKIDALKGTYFEPVYLNDSDTKSTRIRQELLTAGIQSVSEKDEYINAGTHTVVLIITDNYKPLARWNKSELLTVDGDYGEYAVFSFSINKATNYSLQQVQMKPWDCFSYDEEANAPRWSTQFVTEYNYKLVSKDGSKVYYYTPLGDEQLGFDKADAGSYWLIPIASGTGNVKELNTEFIESVAEQQKVWLEIVIDPATVAWDRTSIPKIDSWKYGDDKNYTAPSGTLDEKFSSLQDDLISYFCLFDDYVKITEGQTDVTTYPDFKALQNTGSAGYVPAGNYVYVYELPAISDNYAKFLEPVFFSVIKADNYWDITPVIHDWAYGDNDSISISYKPHFGDAKNVEFQYRLIDANGVPSVWKSSIRDLFDKNGQLPIGKYEYSVSMPDTNDYELNSFNAFFYVTQNSNSWEKIPTVIGWSEGGYDAQTPPEAKSRFGTVYFTVKDADGNVVMGLERLTADELNAEKLNSLGVGTYKLIAEVDETADYEKLYAEASFAVFEDSVGMTGIIAATIVFAVIAVGLAVAGVILLIRKNKKIEKEFREMVKSELKRR